MKGQNILKLMGKGVYWIENERQIDTKCLKLLNNTFWWKITTTLGPSISRTKCDGDKSIFSAEKGGQSDCVEVLKISKKGVITSEPLYHAQVWEYPPPPGVSCQHWESNPSNCKGGMYLYHQTILSHFSIKVSSYIYLCMDTWKRILYIIELWCCPLGIWAKMVYSTMLPDDLLVSSFVVFNMKWCICTCLLLLLN